MLLRDFYLANDAIDDTADFTIHETEKSYIAMQPSPAGMTGFHFYMNYTVESFNIDKNGNWHVLVKKGA